MTMMNIQRQPRYPEEMVRPMREELTSAGVEEWRDVEAVTSALERPGTAFVVINSVCGCAAGGARPAVRLALENEVLPNRIGTVFAGVDLDAVDRVRSLIPEYPPSSPSMALFKDGQLVFFMPRHHIEGRSPEAIAQDLKEAFNTHCQ